MSNSKNLLGVTPRTPVKSEGRGREGREKEGKKGMGREGREGELCSCKFSLKIPCTVNGRQVQKKHKKKHTPSRTTIYTDHDANCDVNRIVLEC